MALLDDPTIYNFVEQNFNIGIAAFSPDMSMAYDTRGLLDLKSVKIIFKNTKD